LEIQRNGLSYPIQLTVPATISEPVTVTPIYDSSILTIINSEGTSSYEFNEDTTTREFVILAGAQALTSNSLEITWELTGNNAYYYSAPETISISLIDNTLDGVEIITSMVET